MTQREQQLADALVDIIIGADMMLHPALAISGSIREYICEVKRVAEQGLRVESRAFAGVAA